MRNGPERSAATDEIAFRAGVDIGDCKSARKS